MSKVKKLKSKITETKDDENSDIEDEDTGKDGNDADIVETDTPDDMDEAEATETEDDSDDANDEELDKIEEDKKAEEPKKKVYASIFMGWALEDGKDTFIPKWKAGDIVQNLVAEDGGEITLYAVWDDCPWIQAQDLYYTLEQAQSGFITEEEILSHATATDREDGSPILREQTRLQVIRRFSHP